MRILAVRGCNLASLAGEFEIDLVHGALGSAGVFAIVGPTGAGKSTLLDAICVALFDRTPRLTNRSTVSVGRGPDDPAALGAQDVRTILRRGAAAGWAEVDFESGDARRYRARWSVRRARDRSDGNLQAQQITLTAIDGGERFGGTRTETLEAIHDRLGLSFDQFRRSALLAQGEFAAFLSADGKDRSELLERMTGTEIYSRLSIAAHVKAAAAEQALRDGRTAVLAIPVLDDDARVACELARAAATDATRVARARHAAADASARWVAGAVERLRARMAADTAHAAARASVAAAEPSRAELAERRRAETLRAPWDELAGVARRLAIARGELSAATVAEAAAHAGQIEVRERRGAVAALHEPVRATRIAVGIVERPDRRIPMVNPGALVDASTDAAWLGARLPLVTEIATWSELDPRFAQRAALADQIAAIDATLRGHADQRTKLVGSRAVIVLDQQSASAKLAEVRHKSASFKQRPRITLDDARRLEDEARASCTAAERLVAIAAGARAALATRDELDRQIDVLAAAVAADLAHETATRGQLETATVIRGERTRIVDELRRASGFVHARAELVDGDPCPLCGATEHPWHDRGALDDVIREAEVRLAEVTAQRDHATATLATLAARGHAHARERTHLVTQRATAVASVAAAAPTWREHLIGLGELVFVDDPAAPAAERFATDREVTARKRLEDARATREQVAAAVKAAADVQNEIQLWLANVEQIAMRLGEVDRKLAELDATTERVRGERAGRIERHAELAGELEAAIARWTAALPADDRDGWLARPRGKRLARTTRSAPTAPPDLDLAATTELGLRLDRMRVAMAELATAWRTRVDRVADADAALTAAVAQLDREASDVERALSQHAARRADAERRCAEVVAEHAAALARFGQARVIAGFAAESAEADPVARLLAESPARIEELHGRLAVLDRAVDVAATLVAERTRLVLEHLAVRPPDVALDEVAVADLTEAAQVALLVACTEQLAATTAAVAEAEQRAAQLVAELAADTAARTRRATLVATLAIAERDAEVVRVLGEVIGSHDGKLFRSFAQSLTLDGLLSVANAHLEELAPRYQLERVPRHDLELQVIDRDLGGEVRSVQSLSGGESFLVSLALALGLSSMSAHDVRVRTLLIDEGFGTLDPATLDGALAVLDRLQATGCQVGVISHVPALVERVGAHVRVNPRGGGRSEVIVA